MSNNMYDISIVNFDFYLLIIVSLNHGFYLMDSYHS